MFLEDSDIHNVRKLLIKKLVKKKKGLHTLTSKIHKNTMQIEATISETTRKKKKIKKMEKI